MIGILIAESSRYVYCKIYLTFIMCFRLLYSNNYLLIVESSIKNHGKLSNFLYLFFRNMCRQSKGLICFTSLTLNCCKMPAATLAQKLEKNLVYYQSGTGLPKLCAAKRVKCTGKISCFYKTLRCKFQVLAELPYKRFFRKQQNLLF